MVESTTLSHTIWEILHDTKVGHGSTVEKILKGFGLGEKVVMFLKNSSNMEGDGHIGYVKTSFRKKQCRIMGASCSLWVT